MLTDRVICVITLLLAAVYLYATAQIPSLEIGDPLGPKAFPRLLGIGLIIGAVLLFLETVRAGKQPAALHSPSTDDRRHLWMIAAVTGWSALYFAVFETLGFIIATVIYLLAMMAYFNRGKWLVNILTSALFSLGSYYFFTKILGVTLAKGAILPF